MVMVSRETVASDGRLRMPCPVLGQCLMPELATTPGGLLKNRSWESRAKI
jgi:hypothetical protein